MRSQLEVAISRRQGEFSLEASFSVPLPAVTALFGRSGSGKTTLVNVLAGLLAPDSGRICLGDEVLTDTATRISVPAEQRRMGYVFQEARLFPHLSVAGNLRYGERRARRAPRVIGFDEVVALLALEPLLARRPRHLSGGERQRVALGRALLSQPRLLLLDEPLSSLDAARREEVLPYLVRLRDRLAIPMVYVSHDIDEVLRLATHVVVLEAGRVVAAGGVEPMSTEPALQAIVGPELVGAVLEGTVLRSHPDRGSTEIGVGSGILQVSLSDVAVGARVRLQLLARDVILATHPVAGLSVRNALPGTVSRIDDDTYGAVLVRVDVGGPTVLARITPDACRALALVPGGPVWALVKAVSTRGHAFPLAPGR